jgi:hypothetical protein
MARRRYNNSKETFTQKARLNKLSSTWYTSPFKIVFTGVRKSGSLPAHSNGGALGNGVRDLFGYA